jgi:hypothetical protein
VWEQQISREQTTYRLSFPCQLPSATIWKTLPHDAQHEWRLLILLLHLCCAHTWQYHLWQSEKPTLPGFTTWMKLFILLCAAWHAIWRDLSVFVSLYAQLFPATNPNSHKVLGCVKRYKENTHALNPTVGWPQLHCHHPIWQKPECMYLCIVLHCFMPASKPDFFIWWACPFCLALFHNPKSWSDLRKIWWPDISRYGGELFCCSNSYISSWYWALR